MLAIVARQPSMGASTTVSPVNGLPPFTMPEESSNRLALITPSLAPRDAAPSPPPLQITKPSALPLAIASAALVSAPGSQLFLASEEKQKAAHIAVSPPSSPKESCTPTAGARLNKFVRRLHGMLEAEQNSGSGIVEWRRGLLVLHSTDAFAKTLLPLYFNTRNFKTFRRQLNYYGFVHVRSFSTTGTTTTALWVNRDLAQHGTADISSVLMLKRVEPCESAKTAEGRRVRKELAVSTVEDDIGVSAKSLQLEQIRSMALRKDKDGDSSSYSSDMISQIPLVVHCHGVDSTTTTIVGGFMPRNDGSWISVTSASAESSDAESDNKSAANLLLMLSKSTTSSM